MRRIIRTSSSKNGWSSMDRFFVCFFALFCIGVIFGTLFVSLSGYKNDGIVFKIWQQNLALLKDKSVFSVFLHSFLSCAVYLIVIYSLGVCAVGSVFLPIPCLVMGVGKGIFFGLLCLEGGFLQYVKSLVFFAIQNIVLCTSVLMLLCLSLKMSIQTFCGFANLSLAENTPISFKKYNQWYLIALGALFLNCILDAVLMRFY